MTAKVVSSSPISRGGQAKGKSSAEGGLERASESLKRRPNSRSRRARDGHRFESPQLHQEVAANRPGFPAPTIPGLFSALARRLMVCGVYSAGTTGLAGERGNESPTPNFGFPTARLADRRSRTVRIAISVRRAPLAPTLTIGQATP